MNYKKVLDNVIVSVLDAEMVKNVKLNFQNSSHEKVSEILEVFKKRGYIEKEGVFYKAV